MKKVLLSLAAVTALAAAAAPAAAQTYGYDRNPGRSDTERLERRIERAEMNGRLTRREAGRLLADVHNVERVAWRYRQDGRLSQWERNDLDRRVAAVEARLRVERNDREYGHGYGYRR